MAKKKESGTKGGKPATKAPGEPVYSVMAFVTFVALAVGCTLLYLDFDEYGKTTGPTEKVPTLTKLGDVTANPVGPAPPAPAPDPMGAPMPMGMPMPTMP